MNKTCTDFTSPSEY